MDRGAWQAAVHRVSESEVAKTRFSTHTLRQGLSNVSCSFVDAVDQINWLLLKYIPEEGSTTKAPNSDISQTVTI